jgi:hypothetical protein
MRFMATYRNVRAYMPIAAGCARLWAFSLHLTVRRTRTSIVRTLAVSRRRSQPQAA